MRQIRGVFNKNFYPTPEGLIERMLNKLPYPSYLTKVLEPSAGSGAIADYIKKINKTGQTGGCKIDCIELDPDLRNILKGKKLSVIHDDFLTYTGFTIYKYIIMNPPFDSGDKHLLKAIEIQERFGGEIVCILNAETIKNSYSKSRQELLSKLELYNADIEFIKNAFTNADRKTNVEIALIHVNIKKGKVDPEDSLIFKNLKQKKIEQAKQDLNYYVTSGDYLTRIVEMYNFEVESGLKLMSEYEKLKPLLSTESGNNILTLGVFGSTGIFSNATIEEFVAALRLKYWRKLFNSDKYMEMFTENLKKVFSKDIETLANYDFSKFNILEVTRQMQARMVPNLEASIIELFDNLSYKYSMGAENNVHYYNGWKTNKAFKINNTKVIIPLYMQGYSSSHITSILDIERVLNFLDNGKTEGHTTFFEAREKVNERAKKVDFKYFTCDFFAKGTCHIKWKDSNIIDKLNIYGGKHYNFLPDSYGDRKSTRLNSSH